MLSPGGQSTGHHMASSSMLLYIYIPLSLQSVLVHGNLVCKSQLQDIISHFLLPVSHKASNVQAAAGRDFQGQRWGPRPLDLDIIFYGDTTLASKDLQIPHARWQERDFVKAPIADLYTTEELQDQQWSLAASLRHVQHLWYEAGGTIQNVAPVIESPICRLQLMVTLCHDLYKTFWLLWSKNKTWQIV